MNREGPTHQPDDRSEESTNEASSKERSDRSPFDVESRERRPDTSWAFSIQENPSGVVPLVDYQRRAGGEWTAERAKYDLRDRSEAHKRQLEAEEAGHRRSQEAKDHHQRRQQERLMFAAGLGIAVVLLVVGLLAGLILDTAESKASWARSLVTAILGAYAGYLTGKAGRET